jgi:hypothetical protein
MPEKVFRGLQSEDCIMAGCEGQDSVKEREGILEQLSFISRQLPYLLNLLAESDPEGAKDFRSSLILILQEDQKKSYRISGERIMQNRSSK